VLRTIVGFHEDDAADWVAELDCHHGQHVRHEPPFRDRPWVLTESGRADRIGSPIECPLCDRAELPSGLSVVRTAGPFDAGTLPAGLRSDHRVADGVWAVVRVLDGTVFLSVAVDPAIAVELEAGGEHAIPPGVAHHVTLGHRGRLVIDFLRPAA